MNIAKKYQNSHAPDSRRTQIAGCCVVATNSCMIPNLGNDSSGPLDFRPGKVDLLFPISHFLNIDVGGWLLFIIRAPVTLPGAFHTNWKISPLKIIHEIMSCTPMVLERDKSSCETTRYIT